MIGETEAKIITLLSELIGNFERLDERTNLILAQTTKTNGKVAELEREIVVLKQNQATAAGAGEVKKEIKNKGWEFLKIILNPLVAAGVAYAIACFKGGKK